MRSYAILSIVAVVTSLSATVVFGQQPEGRNFFEVVSVDVDASGGSFATDAKEYVLSRIVAKEGAFVGASDLARDERSLLDTGSFSDVRIISENVGDKTAGRIKLTYKVVIAPRFKPPALIVGNEAFSERKIRKLLDLTEGDRIDQARLDRKCDKVRDEYRKKYYPDVTIKASISAPDADGFSRIRLVVDEGSKSRIAGFDFSGNKTIPSSELSGALGKPSWYNPVPFFYTSWRKEALDFAKVGDTVADLYREQGYLDVEVRNVRLVPDGDGGAPRIAMDIEEGDRYRLGRMSITGVSLFPESAIRAVAMKAFGVTKEGDVATGSAVSGAAKAIREYFTSRGYADTTVRTRLMPTGQGEDGTVLADISYAVAESGLAHVRSVSIRGNTRTRDKVIRRELTIAPGLILNEVAVENSKRRVQNLGFFENVRYHEVPSREDPLLRDLVYEVDEKNTGQLMVGIGTSSIDDVLGYLEISQNNFDIANWPTFRGGGQKAKLSIELGSSSNSGEISWTDPWFLDRRRSLTVDLYRREISYSEYDETRIGGGVSLTVPLHYGRGTARVGVEHVATDDIVKGTYTLYDDPSRAFAFTDLDDSYLRVPLRLSWLYDTRDRAFAPTSGTRNTIFTEVTSGALGSEYDTWRLGCDLRQYVPLWWGHVLSLRLRAESVDGFGDTDEPPINDRLFLGGGRSVRGYRYRQVGPKALPDEGTGGRARPVGGQTLAMFSAEYAIPVAGFLRFASFFDIGNVWADPFDADFGEYASSWGLGVRFDIPGFPIRLDYAFPSKADDDYTRKEHFIFWIGID
ncbi:MAG: outer membrane protein assembly factor BamA [Kiritimatiellae bacterium]|nr:outer membrane protein assembly factor BamA [Kiritimatiellia bacterium]